MGNQKYVVYLRCSTSKQHDSGLGLEAQRAACEAFTQNGEVLREFVEVESGGKSDRPELLAAIDLARRSKATLIVAKLCRLARSVSFVSALMESGIDFIAADNPNATKLTIHILSAMAEFERDQISKRTKEALAAAKARGVKLGNPKLTNDQRRKGGVTAGRIAKEKAKRSVAHLIDMMKAFRRDGLSLQAIADRLNSMGERTTRGGLYSTSTVHRILARS